MSDTLHAERDRDQRSPPPSPQPSPLSTQHSALSTLPGAFAGVVALAASVAARLLLGLPALLETLADAATALLPLPLFAWLLQRLGELAKPLLYALLLAGVLAVAAAVGRSYGRGPVGWVRLLRLSLAPTILLVAAVLVASGASVEDGTERAALPLAGVALALAVFVGALYAVDRLARRVASRGRRRLLAGGLGLLSLGMLGGLAGLSLRTPTSATSAAADAEGLPPAVTPTDDFYIVSKNFSMFGNPVVDAERWRLEIDGFVARPFSLGYDELLALPAEEVYLTLSCISNEVGGPLISTALWRGVPLARMLERAGPLPEGARVSFLAADGYSSSVPLAVALARPAMVAYAMNGQPLPRSHGYPARVLLPGRYGMKCPKWLRGIRLVGDDDRGYWESRGWSDSAIVKTASRIDLPRRGAVVPAGRLPAGGIAFAGDRGVAGVEVSLDGGRSWARAATRPPLSPWTWVLWTWEARLPPGQHELRVRAVDGRGEVQSEVVADPLPDGASGHHTIAFTAQA